MKESYLARYGLLVSLTAVRLTSSMGVRTDGFHLLSSFAVRRKAFAVRRKLEPSVPHYYGVTHAHFVVASGTPFASNSL
jgi:hypothetical protein